MKTKEKEKEEKATADEQTSLGSPVVFVVVFDRCNYSSMYSDTQSSTVQRLVANRQQFLVVD